MWSRSHLRRGEPASSPWLLLCHCPSRLSLFKTVLSFQGCGRSMDLCALLSTESDFTWGLWVRDGLILYPRFKCSPPLSLPRCKPPASLWWLIPMKLPGGEQSPHACPETGKPTEKSEAEADKPIPPSSSPVGSILSSQCEDEPVPL